MKKALAWLDANFEDAICGVLLLVIMSMLLAQVFVRAVFGHGLTVSEEISRFSFLFLVYIASSLVASKGAHIRVMAQMVFFPKAARTAMLMAADALWLLFNAVVIMQGTKLIISMAARPMISGSLLIDLKPIYAVLPLAFALQSLRILQRWVRYFSGRTPLVEDEVGMLEDEAAPTAATSAHDKEGGDES